MCVGSFREHGSAEHVIAERLTDLALQQWNMLERSGVENDLGARILECALARHRIATVAEAGVEKQVRIVATKFLLDLVQVVLAQLQHRKRLGAKARELSTQLRPDRATAAADQHTLAGQTRADRCPVEVYLLTAEQVLDRDFFQFIETGTPCNDVFEARNRTEWQITCLAQVHRSTHLRLVRGRHCNGQQLGAGLARELRQLVERAKHWNTMQARAAQLHVVIEKADRHVAVLAAQVAHQGITGFAGAEHEDTQARCARKIEAAVFPVSIQQSRRAKQDRKHQRIDDQHGARNGLQAVVQRKRHRDRERAQHSGFGDVPQVRQAGKAPQAFVKTGPPENKALCPQHDPDFDTEQRNRRRVRHQ